MTNSIDLFAEPVYQFTFKDSPVISTCIGSLCSFIFVALLGFVLFGHIIDLIDQDPRTFSVTEGIDQDYYAVDETFNKHSIAVGLQYKAEF